MKNIIKDSSRLFLGGNVPEVYQNPFGPNKVFGVVKPAAKMKLLHV